jgi:hypothetical protein
MDKRFSIFFLLFLIPIISGCGGSSAPGNADTSAPGSTVKLIFIHHSTGQNWLETGYGNLGQTLNANNYYVSDSNYDWDFREGITDPIGDHTDTFDWPSWFNDTIMPGVYARSGNTCYTNTITDPTGENEIIMFKSCFPMSDIGDAMDDEQAIYNSLLPYFQSNPDKMFVLCVPPPQISISYPAITRSLANWLCDSQSGWLSGYTGDNVFVFDLYNVLTSPQNHHWVDNGNIKHVVASSNNVLYYPTGDSHPSETGSRKATAEFVPLLNAWYHQWKEI